MSDNLLWNKTLAALFKHFYYSIEDINSYEELTKREKEIIDKEIYDYLVRLKDNKWQKNTEL